MHLQVGTFIISELHVFLQRNSGIRFVTYIPWLRIKRSWCFPVNKFHLCARLKVQGELTTFRPKPKAVFTPVSIHVRISRSGECFIVHPTKAQSLIPVGSRCKYFGL